MRSYSEDSSYMEMNRSARDLSTVCSEKDILDQYDGQIMWWLIANDN